MCIDTIVISNADVTDQSERKTTLHRTRLPKFFTDLASTSSCNIIPGRLRPRPDVLDISSSSQSEQKSLKGNVILNIPLTEQHFNRAIRCHIRRNPNCDGSIVFDPGNIVKRGLGLRVSLHCNKCAFSTDQLNFYQEADRRGSGRKPAKINVQLAVALAKHPVGATTFIEILSTCEVLAPSAENLRKSTNKAADTFEELNQQQLSLNRKLIKNEIASRSAESSFKVQCDASYNNCPKGRSFSQPGTQSYCPVFCSENGLDNVPLALSTVSKLCSCPYKTSGSKQHSKTCQSNFNPSRAISNAEFVLGQECARDLVADEIIPKEVVTDGVGSGGLYKGISSVVQRNGHGPCFKQDCSKHLSSSLRRNLRKINLNSVYLNVSQTLRKNKQGRLLDFIAKRAIWEFNALYRKYKGNIEKLKGKCFQVKSGIIACVKGDRETCISRCRSCYLHVKGKPARTPRSLPDFQYVEDLSAEDERKILAGLDKKLGPRAVESQRYNLNTNRCEASHRTTQASVPKSKTFIRTFKGRVHAACHSMCVGRIRSLMMANKQLGAENNMGTLAFKSLKSLHRRYSYLKDRNRSKALKIGKVKRKLHIERSKAMKTDFGHTDGCDDIMIQSEHSYNIV